MDSVDFHVGAVYVVPAGHVALLTCIAVFYPSSAADENFAAGSFGSWTAVSLRVPDDFAGSFLWFGKIVFNAGETMFAASSTPMQGAVSGDLLLGP